MKKYQVLEPGAFWGVIAPTWSFPPLISSRLFMKLEATRDLHKQCETI